MLALSAFYGALCKKNPQKQEMPQAKHSHRGTVDNKIPKNNLKI